MNQKRRIEKALALVEALPAAVMQRRPAHMRSHEADSAAVALVSASASLRRALCLYRQAEERKP